MPKKDTEGACLRLRSMPPDNLQALQTAIRAGKTPTMIARIIQQEWGLLKDMKENSLVRQVIRYRDMQVLPPIAALLGDNPMRVEELGAIVRNSMDVLQGMEELLKMQMERIQDLRSKEKTLKMPFQWASKEIEVAAGMYKELLKMQIDTGLVDYRGPLLNKSNSVSVTTPDGTKVVVGEAEDQYASALNETMKILQGAGIIDVGPIHMGAAVSTTGDTFDGDLPATDG